MARYLDPKYDLTLKRVCGEHKKMPVHGKSILRSMCYPVDIRLSALVILLCLSAFWTAVSAQQAYPVQSYTQVIPPYTPYTPNYYTGMKEKLKVRLINMDMQHPLINVRLRMKITSSFFSIENHEYIYTPAIQLFPGDNITLSLQDLEPYFRSNALRVNGNQTEFSRTRMLPDGQYIFRFDVFEERTGKQLNNPNIGYAIVYIASGDPPRLNLPEKGRIIPESGMTSIMFTWTPRHFNSLAAAYGTEYEFSMVELYDKKMPPEGAFTYSAPFYTELVRPTAFIYNATHPMLKVGHRYAWRVRAVAKDELQDEISVFKNSGYSEVFYFDYTADCKTPTFLGAIVERGRVNITWDDVMATEYTLEYRKKGSLRWTTVPNINVSQAYIYACQYGKEYEYRVGTRCALNDAFGYTAVKTFQMPPSEQRAPDCGIMPTSKNKNRTPAEMLIPGQPFMAGDFPVVVTKVQGTGASGFTGEGYVGIPYLKNAQIAVTFNNIVVNTHFQLISGFVETKYDPVNNNLLIDIDKQLTGGAGVGDIRDGKEVAAFKVNYTINPAIPAKPFVADNLQDGITGSDGGSRFTQGENGKYRIVFTDADGNEHTEEADGFPFTVQDADGTTYVVTDSGTVAPISTADSPALPDKSVREQQSSLATLEFQTTPNTKYALDPYKDVYAKVTEYFLKYKPTTNDMIASAKFMAPGVGDEIFVKVVGAKEGFDPEKVHFVTDRQQEYKGVYDAAKGGWTVTLAGGAAGDGQHLYVSCEESKGKYVTLARLNIFTYEAKNIKIKLVPVNGFTNGFTAQSASSQLNAIYNKVGITFEVEMGDNFNYPPDKLAAFKVQGSGLFATETDDMKALYQAYLQENPDVNTACLFIINESLSDGTVGDMPRGKQFGYLFSGATGRTAAHELGHGLFNLDHPFDRANAAKSFAQGDLADNLMEYGNGTNLVKLQWDAIHAPGVVIGLFETDKGGMSVSENYASALYRIIKTIQCGKSQNATKVKLFLPTNDFRVKLKSLTSLLNWLIDCDDEYVTCYISGNDYANFGNDYVEDVYNLNNIIFSDNNKRIVIKGEKSTLFIAPYDLSKSKDRLECIYKVIKSMVESDGARTVNYSIGTGTPSLDELQYASPCEFGSITLQKRKDLLKEISESSITDSREKTAIQLVSSVPPSDCAALLSYLAADGALLRKLYEGIDDYRGEFVAALSNLFHCGKSALADVQTASFALMPGVTEQRSSDIWESVFGWLYTPKLEVNCSFTEQNTIAVSSKKYRGMSIALESLWKEGQKQFEARPFDVVRFLDYEGAGVSFVDIPLIVYKAASDKSIGDAVKKDFGALGKQTLDMALLRLGVMNMAGASAMLKQEVTLRNVVRLIVGSADLAALELGIVCNNSDSEFCKAYKEYELLILAGLFSANILNEMPALYNGLKKGLDDPKLTTAQKNKLREILGESAGAGSKIPGSLIAKITQSGATKLEGWLAGKTLSFADDAGTVLRGANAEAKILERLETSIGNKTVLEVLEDGQGRFSVVLQSDGITYDLVSIQKNVDGNYMLATYNRAYNETANTSINVGVSQNRLVPDYTKNMANQPSTEYLYPKHLLPEGKSPVVKIKMSGKRTGTNGDFYLANQQAGLTGTKAPEGYVWHHIDDFNPITGECTMQLVRENVHNNIVGMAHSGAVAQYKNYYINVSKTPNKLFYTQ